jgi:hypothetical protein
MSNCAFAMAALGLAAMLSAGCGVLGFGDGGSSRPPPPEPLLAAPSGAVTETSLPPPGGTDPNAMPTDLAALDPAQQTAGTTTPPSGTVEVTRPDLLGAWTVSAAGESCQLTMVLTTWTGGYRASTRGCTSTMLQGISAWILEGNQVQLMNDTGATVARLYPSSTTQFNGQSEGGGPITVSR